MWQTNNDNISIRIDWVITKSKQMLWRDRENKLGTCILFRKRSLECYVWILKIYFTLNVHVSVQPQGYWWSRSSCSSCSTPQDIESWIVDKVSLSYMWLVRNEDGIITILVCGMLDDWEDVCLTIGNPSKFHREQQVIGLEIEKCSTLIRNSR